MDKKELRIVYMGTPDFAVESLKALIENGYNVVGVVTMPDKPMGRHGSVLQSSAVKKYALSMNLPVLQPEKMKDEVFLHDLKALRADLQIVVAFRMLPEVVWGMPSIGTFNLHGSLLPQYRGAAPINWAIINGDKETGVTTFFLTHEIDTGKIILQKHLPIKESDNMETVHDALMVLGAEAVLETVDRLLIGGVEAIDQKQLYTNEAMLRPAPKLFKTNCRIDWDLTSKRIHDFIRGLSPYPAAWTKFISPEGKSLDMKIYESEYIIQKHLSEIGTISADGKNTIDIAVSDGYIRIKSLQLEGKKKLSSKEFLNGFKQISNYIVK